MIDKAVVAYRKPLDRPFFTVSLRDAAGRLLEPPADTPPGHYDRGTRTIAADHCVLLRTPLCDLPGGARPHVTAQHSAPASGTGLLGARLCHGVAQCSCLGHWTAWRAPMSQQSSLLLPQALGSLVRADVTA